jgi:anti-sigma regulatory factor (Ser/Thr protein kinase)
MRIRSRRDTAADTNHRKERARASFALVMTVSEHCARYQLPAGALTVVLARRAVAKLPLDRARAGQAKLVVSELVANSVEHGRLAPGDHIELRALFRPGGTLRVEVLDDGPGPPARVERGLGWRVIDRVADRWGVACEDGRACVWFELDAHRAA